MFYPFVKDKTVTDGKTLRDILVSYSSENEIATIEKNLPLLTVMIPDLASFGAFSINKWDTSDEQVAVTYAKDNDNSVFYAEGDSLLSLPKGDLPNFPFMVVKSNERMKVVGKEATRSGGYADMNAKSMILSILHLMEQNLVKQGQSFLIITRIIQKLLQKINHI